MLTGGVSKIIVIDLDPRSGSEESIQRLAAQGKYFPDTVMSATPRGGNHLYFAFDARVAGQPSATHALGKAFPGIDVKTNGGYIVLPPSHWWEVRQVSYRWLVPPRGNSCRRCRGGRWRC